MHKLGYIGTLLILCILQFVQCYYDNDPLEDRVSVLEQKVEELEDEALTRNGLITLLSQGSDSGDSEEKQVVWDQRISPVTVIEVRRESLGSKTKFSVKYKRDVDDITIMWSETDSFTFEDNPLDYETWETSAIVLPSKTKRKRDDSEDDLNFNLDELFNLTAVDFNFTSLDADFKIIVPIYVSFTSNNGKSLTILLRNGDEDVVETDISLPVFKVEPQGDFVYENGQDVKFKIKNPPTSAAPIMSLSYFLYLDAEEVKLVFMEPLSEDSTPEFHEKSFILKTSENRTSGIINLSAHKNGVTETGPVETLYLDEMIILSPSTQPGPFPSGFVDIIEPQRIGFGPENDSPPETVVFCDRDGSNWCYFGCIAAADYLDEIKVFRLESDGSRTPISEISSFSEFLTPLLYSYVGRLDVKFPVDTIAEGNSQRFSCSATNIYGDSDISEILVKTDNYFL